jgi:hypothetical protein
MKDASANGEKPKMSGEGIKVIITIKKGETGIFFLLSIGRWRTKDVK